MTAKRAALTSTFSCKSIISITLELSSRKQWVHFCKKINSFQNQPQGLGSLRITTNVVTSNSGIGVLATQVSQHVSNCLAIQFFKIDFSSRSNNKIRQIPYFYFSLVEYERRDARMYSPKDSITESYNGISIPHRWFYHYINYTSILNCSSNLPFHHKKYCKKKRKKRK